MNSHRPVWGAKRLPSSKWKHCKRKWMCFVSMQECTSKADWGWVIGPCKSNRLWRLLVSIIFKCPGYLSLQMFWESGYLHSSVVIMPPWAPGKTALSTSLQTEHPLHGTHWVTRHLGGSGQAPSLANINAFPGRAPHCSRVLCWGGDPTLGHHATTFARCCWCQAFA